MCRPWAGWISRRWCCSSCSTSCSSRSRICAWRRRHCDPRTSCAARRDAHRVRRRARRASEAQARRAASRGQGERRARRVPRRLFQRSQAQRAHYRRAEITAQARACRRRSMEDNEQRLKTIVTIAYALQAAGFFFGITWIVAVIVDYVKRDDARGTWLESHFRWQIRTFWFGVLWVAVCALFVIATLGIGLLIAWLPLVVVGLWFIYRIARGWMRLTERRPMY